MRAKPGTDSLKSESKGHLSAGLSCLEVSAKPLFLRSFRTLTGCYDPRGKCYAPFSVVNMDSALNAAATAHKATQELGSTVTNTLLERARAVVASYLRFRRQRQSTLRLRR